MIRMEVSSREARILFLYVGSKSFWCAIRVASYIVKSALILLVREGKGGRKGGTHLLHMPRAAQYMPYFVCSSKRRGINATRVLSSCRASWAWNSASGVGS